MIIIVCADSRPSFRGAFWDRERLSTLVRMSHGGPRRKQGFHGKEGRCSCLLGRSVLDPLSNKREPVPQLYKCWLCEQKAGAAARRADGKRGIGYDISPKLLSA